MSPHLEKIRRKAERLTRDLSAEQWHAAPKGKWSAAEIFEHLLLTFTATTEGTLKAMQAGQPMCREVTLRDRLGRFYVARLGVFPRGMQAPRHVVPKHGIDADALRRFYDALVAMDATLSDAERRFGAKTQILDHPILGPFTAQEWRQFHRVHAYHHFRQLAARRNTVNPQSTSAQRAS